MVCSPPHGVGVGAAVGAGWEDPDGQGGHERATALPGGGPSIVNAALGDLDHRVQEVLDANGVVTRAQAPMRKLVAAKVLVPRNRSHVDHRPVQVSTRSGSRPRSGRGPEGVVDWGQTSAEGPVQVAVELAGSARLLKGSMARPTASVSIFDAQSN